MEFEVARRGSIQTWDILHAVPDISSTRRPCEQTDISEHTTNLWGNSCVLLNSMLESIIMKPCSAPQIATPMRNSESCDTQTRLKSLAFHWFHTLLPLCIWEAATCIWFSSFAWNTCDILRISRAWWLSMLLFEIQQYSWRQLSSSRAEFQYHGFVLITMYKIVCGTFTQRFST